MEHCLSWTLLSVLYNLCFFATPMELGGLGLAPPEIGNILAVYGVINGLFQIFFFADLHDKYGTKKIYTVAMASAFPLIMTLPLLNFLGRTQGLSWMVWTVVGVQLVISVVMNLGYACVFIYIAAASPNRASLGATNGIAQMVVSIMRALGPASVNSLFSYSIENPHHAWVVYYFMIGLAFIAIAASSRLPHQLWKN